MIRITLRLPDDVHARLTTQAEKDRRSLNSETVHLIEAGLDAVQGEQGNPKDTA